MNLQYNTISIHTIILAHLLAYIVNNPLQKIAIDLYRILDDFLSGRKRVLDDREASTGQNTQTNVISKKNRETIIKDA